MRAVHADFDGRAGTIARWGDSISNSRAYFAPLRYNHQNVPADVRPALDWIQGYVPGDVWAWQTPETGAAAGTTSAWPLETPAAPDVRRVDAWLHELNPEVALVMWGTNDLRDNRPVDEYAANLRAVIVAIKQNGTVPILITPPPRHGYEPLAAAYAAAIADLAAEQSVPLIDYHREVLERAPGDAWDGSLIYSGEGSVYDVERLISGDGVHPSNPPGYRSDFSGEALGKSGFTLLNYLALTAAHDVYRRVIEPLGSPVGDFNHDGSVDAADYTVWRDGLGVDYGPEDYLVWRENFGAMAARPTEPAHVPAPAAAALAAVGCLRLGGARRR